MAKDTVKSLSITYLDATPSAFSNAGQGAVGRSVLVDDYCTTTAAGLQTAGSYYKLVRLPTNARVKSVILASDSGPNLNGALCFDLDLIFSDDTNDGTQGFQQNTIPTVANTGGTVSLATYTGVNLIYGRWKPAAAATAIAPTEFVLNGLSADYSFTGGFMNVPLFQLFGFTDGRGQFADPGGFFDLMAYVATGATTGGVCNIWGRVHYVI